MEQNKSKLSVVNCIAYGGGNLAANLLVTTASTFITYFYTEIVGLSIAVAGAILAFSRVLDGVTDPFMAQSLTKQGPNTEKPDRGCCVCLSLIWLPARYCSPRREPVALLTSFTPSLLTFWLSALFIPA